MQLGFGNLMGFFFFPPFSYILCLELLNFVCSDRGETLTSISRLYGVSIQRIVAVNANIIDVDFVLEGQCLNIPFNAEETQMVRFQNKLANS